MSRRTADTGGGCFLLAFGGFGLFFALLSGGMIFGPLACAAADAADAHDWNRVPCTIVRSEAVWESDFDDGGLAFELAYTYVVDGTTHQGDRYDFAPSVRISGFPAQEEAMRQLATSLRRATDLHCWVDPADPTQAVLSRDWHSPTPWWFGVVFILAGLLFAAIGFGIWIAQRRDRRRRAAA